MKVRCKRGQSSCMFECVNCKHFPWHEPMAARKSTSVRLECHKQSFYCPVDNMPAKCEEWPKEADHE